MQIRWSRLGIPLCMFDRHAPISAEATWDGRYYHGNCRYCGTRIVRKARSTWIKTADNVG